MKANGITELPREFDFKSNINPYGITYHAIKEQHQYVVTWKCGESCHQCTYSRNEFHKRLLKGEFEIL